MTRGKALVLGGASWNTMVDVDRDSNLARDISEATGSAGAGEAMNLASLGWDVGLWAVLGTDEAAGRVRAGLSEAGVELHAHVVDGPSERHVNLMHPDGSRDSIMSLPPAHDEIRPDFDLVAGLMDRADFVSIVIKEHCRPFLELARETGTPIWVDLHDWDGEDPHHVEFFEAADHLFMSSASMPEWREFLDQRPDLRAETIVVTHGELGASARTADGSWVDVPAVPAQQVVDTNGAGDAFLAGFATAWLEEADLESALASGASQAARAVASPQLSP